MHESEADPPHPFSEIRGARCLHEHRIPERDKGTHALRPNPGATGVCRWATCWGKCNHIDRDLGDAFWRVTSGFD